MAFVTPNLDLGFPQLVNRRMQYRFQSFASICVGKDDAGQLATVKRAVRGDDLGAEGALDFSQGGLTKFDDLAGEDICIDDRDSALLEEFTANGFAHANTPSDAKDFHPQSFEGPGRRRQ